MKTAESNNKTNLITLGSLMSITLLSGVVLTSSITSADNDSVVDDVSISVPTSCTMSSSGTNSHIAEINNGQYNSAIGETTINAFCNDNAGFAIYAIGFTGSTLGSNVLANASLSESNIATGTATSGNTSNWAMKLSTITSPAPTYPIIISGSESDTQKETGDPDYSSFQQVPDDYTKVAYRTAGTDTGTNAEGSTLKTTYQVYISPTQPAGTYEGKVKYVMINPNGGTAPTVPTGVTCNPSGTTIGTGNSTDLVCMQDFASLSSAAKTSVLNSMTPEAQYQLYDSRDDKQYYISKLADSNVWMTQNLDFDIVDGGANLNSTNTDVPANWADAGSLTDTYATSDTTWESDYDDNQPESYDPGDRCWNGVLDPNRSTELDTGTTACLSLTESPDHYHVGNYYDWTAAVAMQNSSSNEDGDANQSICPAGWMLPKETGSGSFYNLINGRYTDGTNGNIQHTPVYFVYGGDWFGSSYGFGTYSFYWSSVANSTNYAYALYIDTQDYDDNQPDTQSIDLRFNGHQIRCLAR